jgi:hypothetical protein
MATTMTLMAPSYAQPEAAPEATPGLEIEPGPPQGKLTSYS